MGCLSSRSVKPRRENAKKLPHWGRPCEWLTNEIQTRWDTDSNNFLEGTVGHEFELMFHSLTTGDYLNCGLVLRPMDRKSNRRCPLAFEYRQGDLVYQFARVDWLLSAWVPADAEVETFTGEETWVSGHVLLSNGKPVWISVKLDLQPRESGGLVGRIRFDEGAWKPFEARLKSEF